MLIRILLVLVVVIVVVAWLRAGRKRAAARDAESPTPPTAPGRPVEGPDTMVACAHCGVHLPRGEALAGPGGVYCGAAHRAAAAEPDDGGSGPAR